MSEAQHQPWQVWIDVGGTFTDCLARDPVGGPHRAKVLSHGALRGRIVKRLNPKAVQVEEHWNAIDDFTVGFTFRMLGHEHPPLSVTRYCADQSWIELDSHLPDAAVEHAHFELCSSVPAPVLAAKLVTRTPPWQPLPPMRMRLGTTRGTNALLERQGAPTALFITEGFGDLLLIGDQQRPELFALRIEKPPPLYDAVVEVPERLAADGVVLVPLDLDQLAAQARVVLENSIRVAAVAFMHSYLNPDHERKAAEILRQLGFEHVSCSSSLAPLIKFLPRTQTAVVNAYLAPVIETYLRGIESAASLSSASAKPARSEQSKSEDQRESFVLHVMTSSGGLVRSDQCHAKDSLLSGPAGGVVGAAAAGKQSGFTHIIALDMGGTSTDVARFDGEFEYRFEQRVGGIRLMSPALAIETVAAGGQSAISFTGDLSSDRAVQAHPRGRLVTGPADRSRSPTSISSSGALIHGNSRFRLIGGRRSKHLRDWWTASNVTRETSPGRMRCWRDFWRSPTNGWPRR